MMRYSLGLTEEAASVEAAVDHVVTQGFRTRDIAAPGAQAVGTVEMGDHVVSALESGR
jgi:3-isopropylmalate dehydrogenase